MSVNQHYGQHDEDDDLETLPRRPNRGEPGEARVLGSSPRSEDWLPAPGREPPARPAAYRPAATGTRPPSPPAAPPPAAVSRRSTGRGCIWALAGLAVVILVCGVVGTAVMQQGFSGLGGLIPRLPGLPLVTPTVIIQSQGPSVVQEVQSLSRLETARYTIEKVLTGESTGALPPFTSDKILFVAHGDVTAGIDLSKITDADVQVVSGTVTLTLPPAEILTSRLDNDKSYVYDRQTGLFTKSDPQLESQIRQRAEKEIVNAALEDGILQQAQTNAETTLRAFLHGLRYDNVIFVTPTAVPTTPGASPGTAIPATPGP